MGSNVNVTVQVRGRRQKVVIIYCALWDSGVCSGMLIWVVVILNVWGERDGVFWVR